MDKESCPACGASPCDWVNDPHAYRDSLCMVLADIRSVLGVGEKPMASELAGIIAARMAA